MRSIVVLLLVVLLPVEAAASASGSVFLAQLSQKPRATQDDLVRLLVRVTGRAAHESFDACVGELRHAGILDGRFRAPATRLVTREDAALPVARFLRLQGGFTGKLFGLGRRTAHLDLVARGIIPQGPPSFKMSGAELIGMLDRARQYQAEQGRKP